MKNISIDINPDILRWAREESGYTSFELSSEINIEEKLYLQWENDGLNIPFNSLINIARHCKRQIAVFFLEEVPKKTKMPDDFRNVNLQNTRLSLDSLLAIRRADRFRELLLELNGNSYYEKKYKWILSFSNRASFNQGDADSIRDQLKYTIDSQLNDKDLNSSYINWRICFEQYLGINIFQFSMPPSEIQGFCYSDYYPYCIVVNSKYHVSSKIFTLFHELGHILNRQSGLCVPNQLTDDQQTELEINSFASSVLLPEEVVVRSLNSSDIYKRSRKLKVSSEVYLRRMKDINLIEDDDFFRLLEEIRSAVKPPGPGGRSTPIEKSLNSRGRSL